MHTHRQSVFSTVRTEGAILPPDLLQRIANGDPQLDGIEPESYHLLKGERINEAINRSWSRLESAWMTFKKAKEQLPGNDIGTTITRERWLLPLFQELGYGRLLTAKAIELDGRTYPISHQWQNTPIHLVGCGVDLDRRTAGIAGAARSSPHSLIQELLNSSDTHLWGFVSNGLSLRILRDNVSLTRQAYVEFDLEMMMNGETYSDFALLWLLCHQSRVESEKPESCWLERWSRIAQVEGTRALEQLREGVEGAINAIGGGFLAHSGNIRLKEKLRSGELSKQDYYRQILRLVYRLLFLFVAEDRDLLLNPDCDEKARQRYIQFYSLARIRRLAERHRGTRHSDLYCGVRLVMSKLGDEFGCPELGLPALGSALFDEKFTPDLNDLEISNSDSLDAIRSLAFITDGNKRRPVDYKNMRSEELGSVYESLLELHPDLNADAGTFRLQTVGGNERKTTGSYYTPESLVQCLLDSALDPVLDDIISQRLENKLTIPPLAKGGRGDLSAPNLDLTHNLDKKPTLISSREGVGVVSTPEQRILNLKICDPACGSGHFLIAASHRIARRLASIRTGDDEPSPEAIRTALRDVIGHCVYGVDINPMAVELCKLSLWMEALEPGKPLSFLDHHIQCGNSLLGATPKLLKDGIPDDAFKPIEGDDKAICSEYKKRNKEERQGFMHLFNHDMSPWNRLGDLAASMMQLEDISDDDIEGIQKKQERYQQYVNSSSYGFGHLWADMWCSAFVWKKTKEFPYPITENAFRKVERNPYHIPDWMKKEIKRLSGQYQFFHWHLEFPEVFRVPAKDEEAENEKTGWIGGFDVVLGNPPWEKLQTEELQFFAFRNPDIAKLEGAARKKAIEALGEIDPILAVEWRNQKRIDAAIIGFIRNSGMYPLTGVGKFNTFALFAELNSTLISPRGKVGCIVPSGIATDDTTKLFFQNMIGLGLLVSLYDFENREGIFSGVHRSYKFCLITLTGIGKPITNGAEFIFFAHKIEDLYDIQRRFTLSVEDIALLNPNTFTCPIFRSKRDAELTKVVYQRIPVLIKEGPPVVNPWSIEIHRMLNITDDSTLFLPCGDTSDKTLRIYEAKCFWQYDHRFSNYQSDQVRANDDSKNDPFFFIQTRYVVLESTVPKKYYDRIASWHLSYRRITNATNERTIVGCILPECCLVDSANSIYNTKATDACCLLANLNSYVADFLCRQTMGGSNLHRYILQQLPILSPTQYGNPVMAKSMICNRALELCYTAWDLKQFAEDCGYDGPPFCWNEERRFLIRCELDAIYFHLYGIERDDVDYIMETFPIVKRKDEQKYGEYRTKRVILEIYDAMTEAIQKGKPYQTIVSPPPADPSVAHPPRMGS